MSLKELASSLATGRIRVVDLTQTLGPDTPVIALPPELGASNSFTAEEISHYDDRGPGWYWRNISLGEHTGTHFDAPIHWVSGRERRQAHTDTIPAQRFVAPACVIDCSKEAAANPDFLLTREHIEAWEAKHGRIPAGAWVLMRTDWSKRGEPEFQNLREDGSHAPGPDAGAMRFLAEERDVNGWGSECIGTDAGQAFAFDPPFPAHYYMQGAGKFGLASLCNLDQLPPTGAIVIAAPLKIEQGSGSPVRVVALVEG